MNRVVIFASSVLFFMSCNTPHPMQPVDENFKDNNSLNEKPVPNKFNIYQVMTRLYSNQTTLNKPYGTIEENGVGKFSDINEKALASMKKLGITHIWYTGVLECATMTDYSDYGIKNDNPNVVKGRAGSPFAIKDYYDVNPDLAINPKQRKDEFKDLVNRTHDAGMKVIIDFVANDVARQYRSNAKPARVKDLGEEDDRSKLFSPQNNYYYINNKSFEVPQGYNPLGDIEAPNEKEKYHESPAKATGNNVFRNNPGIDDWFETTKLNYGVDITNGTIDLHNEASKHFDPIPDTWIKMKDILLYWANFGVDGFRCDMAEMVPVEFWDYAITEVKKAKPDVIFIAEIYKPEEYRNYINNGKFDFLYDKVGTYDAIRRVVEGKGSIDSVSLCQKSLDGITSHMLRFIENHDEQRFASRFFGGNALRCGPAMVLTTCMHSGPNMIYFGQESGVKAEGVEGYSGDDGRTTMFDYWGVPEHQAFVDGGKFDGGRYTEEQKQVHEFYRKLLNLNLSSDALKNGRFYDLQSSHIDYNRTDCYSFLRYTNKQRLLIIVNFNNDISYSPTIKLTEAILKAIGCNADSKYTLKNLLTDDVTKANLSDGFKLDLQPNSTFIFEIN
jgi:glycosidase